jgi:hypothetical protein
MTQEEAEEAEGGNLFFGVCFEIPNREGAEERKREN